MKNRLYPEILDRAIKLTNNELMSQNAVDVLIELVNGAMKGDEIDQLCEFDKAKYKKVILNELANNKFIEIVDDTHIKLVINNEDN